MGKTLGELKAQLSYQDLIDWMAYDRLDPIGGYRQDLNTALLALMQSGDKDSKLTDFILIDPDPITEEEADRREAERDRERSREKAENLKAMLRKRLDKQNGLSSE